MKYSEMNAHQAKLFRMVVDMMNEEIGGCENTLLDYDPEDEYYKRAEEFLNQGHDELKEYFLDQVMYEIKRKASTYDANFAGRDFAEKSVDRVLVKMGY